jgi:hypothetical protein
MTSPIAQGSTPYKVLALLKQKPPGTEMYTAEIADLIGMKRNCVAPALRYAERVGLLTRRSAGRVAACGAPTLLWSLGAKGVEWSEDKPQPRRDALMAAFFGAIA